MKLYKQNILQAHPWHLQLKESWTEKSQWKTLTLESHCHFVSIIQSERNQWFNLKQDSFIYWGNEWHVGETCIFHAVYLFMTAASAVQVEHSLQMFSSPTDPVPSTSERVVIEAAALEKFKSEDTISKKTNDSTIILVPVFILLVSVFATALYWRKKKGIFNRLFRTVSCLYCPAETFSEHPSPHLPISCHFNACSQTQWAAESGHFFLKKNLFPFFWQKSIPFTKLSQFESCTGIPEGKRNKYLVKYSLSKISPSPLALKQSLLVIQQRKNIPILKEKKNGANWTTLKTANSHLEPFNHCQKKVLGRNWCWSHFQLKDAKRWRHDSCCIKLLMSPPPK